MNEINGDSRTPKFTTYEAEEAYKLGRKEGAAASEAYHLGTGSNPVHLSAGRPEPSESAVTFADTLRRWNRECSGWEPSMSLLQRGADDAADLIDELCAAIRALQNRAYTFQEAESIAAAALEKAGPQ